MNRRFNLLIVIVSAAILMVACVGEAPMEESNEPQADGQGGIEETEDLSGDVIVDGSSTMYPITTAVAEEFAAFYPNVRVSVGLSGTGGGFEKFCNGEIDISDASRPIRASEAEACTANGIEYTEMLVGVDGLTVVVSPKNDWVTCLSVTQLVQLFGVNSEVVTWADLDPSWPAEEVLFYVPDPDSGTRDFMIEVLEKADESATDLRQDENTTNSGDDNVLLTGVANDANAIGFFGYAYYTEANDQVRAIAIENEAGECIKPSNSTIENGSYSPLSRPLFIYPNNSSVINKPQVASFVRYFMEEGVREVMGDVGYSLPPAGTLEDNLLLLEALLGN